MILASSPSPSRRTTVPVPYLGCSTDHPGARPFAHRRAARRQRFGAAARCRLAADTAAAFADRASAAAGRLPRLLERHAALAEKLRDVVQRVVRLPGVGVAPGAICRTSWRSRYRSTSPGSSRGPRFMISVSGTSLRNQVAVERSCSPPPKRRRYLRPGQDQPLARARHAHVAQPALFLQRLLGIHRPAVREQAQFHAGEEHQRKLQALGVVQRHQRDRRLLVVGIGVRHQRGVVQKIGDASRRARALRRRR